MRVISTNISAAKTIVWQGKEVQTGIFKEPVKQPLILEKTDVLGDVVVDRKYHGGIDKACYLFSADHYPFWKERYPDLNWNYGMFGENLTVKNCDETNVNIGDVYEVGTATIQVSQPRQPCFKLGVRFNDQTVLKDFINQPYPGIYVRVLKSGEVRVGDDFRLVSNNPQGISVSEVFKVLYHKPYEKDLLDKVLAEEFLAEGCKSYIRKKYTL